MTTDHEQKQKCYSLAHAIHDHIVAVVAAEKLGIPPHGTMNTLVASLLASASTSRDPNPMVQKLSPADLAWVELADAIKSGRNGCIRLVECEGRPGEYMLRVILDPQGPA